MRVKTNVKAGATLNHNQTQVLSLKVRGGIKGGRPDEALWKPNHSQAMCGLKVKSGVKAGRLDPYKN